MVFNSEHSQQFFYKLYWIVIVKISKFLYDIIVTAVSAFEVIVILWLGRIETTYLHDLIYPYPIDFDNV